MASILIALILSCVVMMVALVPYGRVLFARALDDAHKRHSHQNAAAPQRRSPEFWGMLFYASWLAIIGSLTLLLIEIPGALSRSNVVLAASVVGGWWGIFDGIIWIARAVARVNARSRAAPP